MQYPYKIYSFEPSATQASKIPMRIVAMNHPIRFEKEINITNESQIYIYFKKKTAPQGEPSVFEVGFCNPKKSLIINYLITTIFRVAECVPEVSV